MSTLLAFTEYWFKVSLLGPTNRLARRVEMRAFPHMEVEILRLLRERGAGKTICPSEVARAVAASEERAAWEPLMQDVRDAAHSLVAKGAIVITQRGQVIDASTAKGPVRLRLR